MIDRHSFPVMKREKTPQHDTLGNEVQIGKEKQAMQKGRILNIRSIHSSTVKWTSFSSTTLSIIIPYSYS